MKRLMLAVVMPALGLVLASPAHAQFDAFRTLTAPGGALLAQQPHNHSESREQYRVEPQRVDKGPVVDGLLDEAVWQRAAVIDSFTQQEPAEGDPATERTEVLLLYDAAHLYIGVR